MRGLECEQCGRYIRVDEDWFTLHPADDRHLPESFYVFCSRRCQDLFLEFKTQDIFLTALEGPMELPV